MSKESVTFRIFAAMLLLCGLGGLCGLSFGGLDESGGLNASNMTTSEFSALVPSQDLTGSFVDTDAPDEALANAGSDVAVYLETAPASSDQRRLVPSTILSAPPSYMYYNGDYLAWNAFTATYPGVSPGLWIERAVSWSFYATLPWGGWTKELLYLPQSSPVVMYEIYPGGYVRGYNLGVVGPGYYYLWYYADSPGRHSSIFSTSSGYSNAVIVDVYYGHIIRPNPPTPVPDPKRECEKNPLCVWSNGRCNCQPAPNPVAECEENPLCHWVNGQCLCTGLDDPEKRQCESNPLCDWVNGECYCRGFNPEPMPGPVPNPTPEPEPEPFNPAPNPVAQCQSSPGCYWDNGRCNCMGMMGGSGSGSGGSEEDWGGMAAEE